ncbi:hypothetical protein NKH77_43520 [Streptomyces sp. M19]
MLRAIRDAGAVMEINTSGNTKMHGGWYPEFDLLERAFHFGVPITFASDAHVPERVCDQYPEVVEVLHAIGFRTWTVFRGAPRGRSRWPDPTGRAAARDRIHDRSRAAVGGRCDTRPHGERDQDHSREGRRGRRGDIGCASGRACDGSR